MFEFFKKPYWSPYVAGSLIGLIPVVLYALSDWRMVGSGAFMDIGKVLLSWLNPGRFEPQSIRVGYRLMFIPGIILGAYTAARLGGIRKATFIPSLWQKRFGRAPVLRAITAFFGGFFLIIGSYLALGCTISRMIWGGLRLDAGAWILMGAMFVTAVVVSWLLYTFNRKKRAQ